ncbi:MAG TPA: chemotaxis protein CheW [Steroidobacteraceae bacterium]|nr:chemotaxis protein CheW [Steroidobacteraceae bacterium]
MNANPTKTAGSEVASQQVLTFVLGEETYGVDILRVQEIRGWSAVTKIPNSPPHVLGVLNLRGSIVPIVDLRKRFNLAQAEYTAVTVIIVLTVRSEAGRRDFGVVVDGVSDVVDVDAGAVKPTPDLGARAATDHIRGLVSIAERMVVLLDIDRLIGSQMVEPVASATDAQAA